MAASKDVAGKKAEALAEAFFLRQGCQILARRFWVPSGEIDLVIRDGSVLVFVEVRSRATAVFGHPLETVGPAKRARVVRAARCYLAALRGPLPPMRFDVVGIVADSDAHLHAHAPTAPSAAAASAAAAAAPVHSFHGSTLTWVRDAFDAGGMRHGR